ncbi:MAG: formyltransferase family protein [Nitrospiraceae bacterium]|nr:formyltransferase family protein [Nitrospiraceae bacterium]
MKIVFIGCVQSSYASLKRLLSLKNVEVIGVVTKSASPFNADFQSLEPLAKSNNIPYYLSSGNDQDAIAEWIRPLQPDVAYCFGWSHLLNRKILSLPVLGVIGYHPAALPRNRGRHPIIWALALGLSETASTFFFMDEGADSGDILDQRIISVNPEDDAASLYQKLLNTALDQIESFTPLLASRKFTRIQQDHSQANYWRKRSRSDGEIDWRMSSTVIHNLVRALSRPYPGAHCSYKEKEIKVWKTAVIAPSDPEINNLEPGKVLEAGNGSVIIKCGEGAIKLQEHGFQQLPEKGTYIL